MQRILKEAQDRHPTVRSKINSSGKKVEKLHYLRQAVSEGYVEPRHVFEGIIEFEECHHQQVYFYRPRDEARQRDFQDAEAIRAKLMGGSSPSFPVYTRQNEGLSWADFRIGLPNRPNDWIAKAYGFEHHRKAVQSREMTRADGSILSSTKYSHVDVPVVMIARWRDPDWLEIRVDLSNASSRTKLIAARLQKFWNLLRPAFSESSVSVWSFRSSGEAMIQKILAKSDPEPKYSLHRVTLLDSSLGSLDFVPKGATETVDNNTTRGELLNSALAAGAQAEGLGVCWLPNSAAPPQLEKPFTFTITGSSSSIIRFENDRLHPSVYDYVLDEIRRHHSPSS